MSNPTCCGEVVESSAMGKSFFYCRGCKTEVVEKVDTNPTDAPADYSPYYYGGAFLTSSPSVPATAPKVFNLYDVGDVIQRKTVNTRTLSRVVATDFQLREYHLQDDVTLPTWIISFDHAHSFYRIYERCPALNGAGHKVFNKNRCHYCGRVIPF